jgi:DNA repair protein RecO (recombination protein O)
VLDAYLLRAMALAGWEPALTACAVCGRTGAHRAFSVASGGCVCTTCRPAGAAAPTAETLELMTALLTGDWLYADASAARAQREASGLIAAHLQWHLERGLRSLPFVERGSARGSDWQGVERGSARRSDWQGVEHGSARGSDRQSVERGSAARGDQQSMELGSAERSDESGVERSGA